jgi:hypothetical protein
MNRLQGTSLILPLPQRLSEIRPKHCDGVDPSAASAIDKLKHWQERITSMAQQAMYDFASLNVLVAR